MVFLDFSKLLIGSWRSLSLLGIAEPRFGFPQPELGGLKAERHDAGGSMVFDRAQRQMVIVGESSRCAREFNGRKDS